MHEHTESMKAHSHMYNVGQWQLCLHNMTLCSFSTFFFVSMAMHVTVHDVRVTLWRKTKKSYDKEALFERIYH